MSNYYTMMEDLCTWTTLEAGLLIKFKLSTPRGQIVACKGGINK